MLVPFAEHGAPRNPEKGSSAICIGTPEASATMPLARHGLHRAMQIGITWSPLSLTVFSRIRGLETAAPNRTFPVVWVRCEPTEVCDVAD